MLDFVKQYGEQRTGTNVLRALLLRNFSDLTVLMHVLGDKHALPVDLHDLRSGARVAVQSVRCATLAAPSATTRAHDASQVRYVDQLADALVQAAARDELGCVVSIREPRAWAASVLRFEQSCRPPTGTGASRHDRWLAERCEEFNAKYAAWLELPARWPGPVAVVRCEDLRADQLGVLERLERCFSLRRTRRSLLPVGGRVAACYWDTFTPAEAPTPYTPERERSLPGVLRTVVEDTIDWTLLREWGYRPERCHTSGGLA